MPHIRPYRPADRDALVEVCLKTADSGGDATGMLADDALWGDLFAVPYAVNDPGLCWVVESDDARTIGYIVSTADTDEFERWFRDEWWPSRRDRYRRSGEAEPTRQDRLLDYADGRGPGREPNATEYPAHLHIDLLPETQGLGLGRQLVQTLLAELGRRGVPALHLGMNPENTAAAAFYERLGFFPLPSPEGTTILGIRTPAG
ncbi:GNAT family N-acetyltransferase [Streptomyces sp. MS2A]|nr:GNAT family N-acetyltransferase [Streptomyces sp. MS2A]